MPTVDEWEEDENLPLEKLRQNTTRELHPLFLEEARSLIPALAAEDTNYVYRVFRRRRGSFGKPLAEVKPPPRTLKEILMFMLRLAGIGLWMVLSIPIALLSTPFVMLMGLVKALTSAETNSRRRRIPGISMAYSATGLTAGTAYRQSMTDLYMTGMTGRILLEAVYLEKMEERNIMSRLALCLSCGAVFLLVTFTSALISTSMGKPLVFLTWPFYYLVQLLLMGLFAAFRRMGFVWSGEVARLQLEKELRKWNGSWMQPPRGVIETTLPAAVVLGLLVIVEIALWVYVAHLSLHILVIAVLFVMNSAMIIAAIWFGTQPLSRFFTRRLEKTLARADDSFQLYLTRTILEPEPKYTL